MSFLGETYGRLAKELWQGNISDSDFYEVFATSKNDVQIFGVKVLTQALLEHNADLVEFGLYIGHRFGFTANHIELLIKLANEYWHTQHENIVDGLGKLRAPASVDTLYNMARARLAYLEYDEAYALGVKSIWALASIDTIEATLRLVDLLSSGNNILEENAKNRLRRLQQKGQSDAVRDIAKKALANH